MAIRTIALSHLKLSSKLHLLIWTVALALVLMASLMLIALNDVKELSKQTATDQVSSLLENARFGRELSEILLDVKLLESNFYGNTPFLRERGDNIQQRLNSLILNSTDEQHREALKSYAASLREYLNICSDINLTLEQQELLANTLHTQLDILEHRLSDWLVDATIQGEEIYFYEQLLALVTGYRETLLKIDRQQATHEGYTLKRQSGLWYLEIDSMIQDFLLRLDTTSASTPEVAIITSNMRENLKLFSASHASLEESVQRFWLYADENEKAADNTFLMLSENEVRTENAANDLVMLIENIIADVRNNILLVLFNVIVFTVVAMALLIQGQIKKPLQGLISGIERFRVGDLNSPITLNRKDEWHQVETALNQMAQDLQRSYEQLREKQSNLNHLAHHDPLTDLPNRLLFMERLEHALLKSDRAGTFCALLFMDLDRFKNVNDSLGHTIGDQLLCEMAKRIKRSIRKVDTAARLGGDEFTVVLDGLVYPHDAAQVAETLLKAFAEPLHLGGRELYITSSIGISMFPQDGDNADALVRNADAAMYKAKQGGRNGYRFYTEQMTKDAFSRMELESSLHKAIINHEFIVFFQPQYDLTTGKLIGAEALVRWHHPEKGLLAPDGFISIAEDTGQIIEIDFWVLTRVCQQLNQWYEHYPVTREMTFSVNLSGRHMEQSNLPQRVSSVVEQAGIDPSKIELEITESFIMHQIDRSLAMLHEIKADGFKVAIDDFGTGYSSLNYLKQLPVDTLKIDRTFIADVMSDKHDEAIVKSVISLGNNLGLSVIAEGIEEQSQLDFLRDVGCSKGQGYFFERPISADDFIKLLSTAQ